MKIESEKLRCLELFNQYKIPSLPYIILKKDNFESQLKGFLRDHKIDKFMIRTAGKIKKFHETPAINNASLDSLSLISDFLKEGFIVIISHPGNTYRNLYSLNLLKDQKEILIDVVGPGFIAPDLNRHGHIHEELTLDKNLTIKNRKTIRENDYEKELAKKITKEGIQFLKENNSYLITYKKYPPLAENHLNFIKGIYPKLNKLGQVQGFDKWMASFSFVDLGDGKNQPIFWDLYGIN